MLSVGMTSNSPLGTRLLTCGAPHMGLQQGFSSRLGGLHNLVKVSKCQALSYGLDDVAQ